MHPVSLEASEWTSTHTPALPLPRTHEMSDCRISMRGWRFPGVARTVAPTSLDELVKFALCISYTSANFDEPWTPTSPPPPRQGVRTQIEKCRRLLRRQEFFLHQSSSYSCLLFWSCNRRFPFPTTTRTKPERQIPAVHVTC